MVNSKLVDSKSEVEINEDKEVSINRKDINDDIEIETGKPSEEESDTNKK